MTVFVEYLAAFGGTILARDGRVALDEPAAVAALEAMRAALVEQEIVPLSALTWHEEETRFAFQNGEALFMRNWPYAFPLMQDPNKSRVAGRFAVTTMPARPGLAPGAAVFWLTGSPVVSYNVAFLLTFPLSGLAVYLLCFELTHRRDAAWLAGLAFAFAPYRMDQLAHLQVLASYWMPLGLFALHRYYRDPRLRWLALFGVSTLMTGLTNGYFLLFYPPLILFWVLWFTPNEGWWRKVARRFPRPRAP